jgi:hypothetical protein
MESILIGSILDTEGGAASPSAPGTVAQAADARASDELPPGKGATSGTPGPNGPSSNTANVPSRDFLNTAAMRDLSMPAGSLFARSGTSGTTAPTSGTSTPATSGPSDNVRVCLSFLFSMVLAHTSHPRTHTLTQIWLSDGRVWRLLWFSVRGLCHFPRPHCTCVTHGCCVHMMLYMA